MAYVKPKRKNYNLFANFNYFYPGWSGIGWLTLWFLVGALLGNLVTLPLMVIFKDLEDAALYAELIAYPLMFIPPMLYASYKSRSNSLFCDGYKLSNDHYKPLGGLFCIIAVMLATLATSFVAELFSSVLPDMPKWLEDTLNSLTGGNIWIDLLCVSIFAPFFEEWLCRGMVLRGLLNFKHKDKETGEEVRGIKPVWAIVASSAFFAIIHLNPWQAIPAFMLGCLFGYVYYRTGSIKLTMLMHFTNNTFAVVMSNIDKFEDVEGWSDILPPVLYAVVFAFCLALIGYVVHKFKTIEPIDQQGSCERLSVE